MGMEWNPEEEEEDYKPELKVEVLSPNSPSTPPPPSTPPEPSLPAAEVDEWRNIKTSTSSSS